MQATELTGMGMPPFLTFEVFGRGEGYVEVIDYEKEMQTIDQIRDYI